MYNFDQIIDRRGTGSLKHDRALPEGAPPDTLSMWVADMDFMVLPEVRQAVMDRAAHGVYGYSLPSAGYYSAVAEWMRRRHGWDIKPEWISASPGVVPALNTLVRAFTKSGDGVMVQRPVYYPFMRSVEQNDRVLVNNPLVLSDKTGRYEIDFDDFERAITAHAVKLFILCNPHNPVGRVFTAEELRRMGDICLRHGVLVVSDEIHHDFVFEGHRHTPFYMAGAGFEQHSIVCTAPSKTFNLAGLQVSNIIIANPGLKQAFDAERARGGINEFNCFGTVACETAYTHGDRWVDELVRYIHGNYELIDGFLRERLPALSVVKPEGLYLVWIDLRGLGLDNEAAKRFVLRDAGIWGDSGDMFGPEGEGFLRLNIACPRAVVREALGRLERAVKELTKK